MQGATAGASGIAVVKYRRSETFWKIRLPMCRITLHLLNADFGSLQASDEAEVAGHQDS